MTQTAAMTARRRTARTPPPFVSSPWAWAKSFSPEARKTLTRSPPTLTRRLCRPDWACAWTATRAACPSTTPTPCACCGRATWTARPPCVPPSASSAEGPFSCRTWWPVAASRRIRRRYRQRHVQKHVQPILVKNELTFSFNYIYFIFFLCGLLPILLLVESRRHEECCLKTVWSKITQIEMGLHFDPTSRVIHSAQKNLGQMYNPQNNLIWGLFRTKRLEYSFRIHFMRQYIHS